MYARRGGKWVKEERIWVGEATYKLIHKAIIAASQSNGFRKKQN